MPILTKHTTDVTVAGNYFANGSIAEPFTKANFQEQPLSPALIKMTVASSFTGADIGSGVKITLDGPDSSQKIEINFGPDGTDTPITPRDTLFIQVNNNAAGNETYPNLMDLLETALDGSNGGLVSVSRTTVGGNEVFDIVPNCGGVWTNVSANSKITFTGSTNGGGFGSDVVSSQAGAGLTLTNTSNNGAFSRLRFTVDGVALNFFGALTESGSRNFRNSTGPNIGELVATGASGTVGNALYSLTQPNFSTLASIANSSDSTALGNMADDMVAALNQRFLGLNVSLIAVKENTSDIIFYNTDTTDLTSPTFVLNSAASGWAGTAITSTRSVTNFVPTIDPHLSGTVSGVIFNNSASTVTRAANSFQWSGYSVSEIRNYNLDCSRGFAFGDIQNRHDSDWRQFTITKSVDAGFTFNICMFQAADDSIRTWRWVNIDVLPTLAGDSSIMLGGTKNQVLDWENVFIRWSSQQGSRFDFDFNTSSTINNSGLVVSGTGTAAGALIILAVNIRQLTPFTIEIQSEDSTSFAFQGLNRGSNADTFAGCQFWAGAGYQGPTVGTDQSFTLFQTGNAHFRMLDFTNNGLVNSAPVTIGNFTFNANLPPSSTSLMNTFNPSFNKADGTKRIDVRNELYYGKSTENSPLVVKEGFESGPIGGSINTITRFQLDTNASLAVGDVITIPRPQDGDITATIVSGTPSQATGIYEFNIGSDANNTIGNLFSALNADATFADNMWYVRGTAASGATPAITFGNLLGGIATAASFSGSGITIVDIQTGADGFGTDTHPFDETSGTYIGSAGLSNVNTGSDNTFKPTVSDIGNNPGLYITNMKYILAGMGITNNIAGSSMRRYLDDYTHYVKCPATRPSITEYKFSDGGQSFTLVPVADNNWEGVAKSVVDAYSRNDIDTLNDLYRWVENLTNEREIINQEDLASLYDRFIDFDVPVVDGLIDFEALNLQLNTTGTKPQYDVGTTVLRLPSDTSLAVGTTVNGVKTTGTIEVKNEINLNTVNLDTTDTITIDENVSNGNFNGSTITASKTVTNGTYVASSTINLDGDVTNGTFTAPTIDSSGISLTGGTHNANTHTQINTNMNGSTLGPQTSGAYVINHSGGNFNDVTLADTFTLNTDDASLHGITGANGIVNYTDTFQNFSVDAPGAFSNTTFNFNLLTQDITFLVDEDLGDCDFVNTTAFNIELNIGSSGTIPNMMDGGSLTGNFTVARSISLGLAVNDEVRYIIADTSSGTILVNSTFTATESARNIPFSSTVAVDIWIKQLGANAYKNKPILILSNTEQDIVRAFEADENLNIAIQDSAANRQIVDDYVSAMTLTIDSVGATDAEFECPATFTSGGTTQTPSDNLYWDIRGSRGAGQYAVKKLEETDTMGLLVLANKASLSEMQPQLFSLQPADTVLFATDSIKLHSFVAVTSESFFPAQFIAGSGVTSGIVGTPNGFVLIYQEANVVVQTGESLAFVDSLLGDQMDERGVIPKNVLGTEPLTDQINPYTGAVVDPSTLDKDSKFTP